MTAGPHGDSCIMGPDVPTVLGGEQRLVVGADQAWDPCTVGGWSPKKLPPHPLTGAPGPPFTLQPHSQGQEPPAAVSGQQLLPLA